MPSLRNRAYLLLRRSETFFKTDMIYLAKGGFWLILLQAVSTITGFALVIAFANLLPPETYGTYQFVLAAAALLSISTLAGLNTAAVRSVARGIEGTIIPGLKTKLRWGSLGSVASIALSIYYWSQGNIVLATSFLVVTVFLPLFYSLGISGALLSGKQLFKINAQYNIIGQLLSAVIVFIALYFTDNITIILLTYFASWTIIRTVLFKLTIRKYKTNDNEDVEMERYGKHLSIMGAMGNMGDYADKLLIFHYLGAVEVAVYSLAIAPVMQLKGLIKHLNTLALPKLSLRNIDEIRGKIIRKSLRVFFISLPLIGFYILAAPYVYKIFFPAYLESISYSRVFALVLAFTALGIMPTTALESQLEVKKKYILTSSSKILKILLMVILVIPYGIWGIIVAIIVTNIVTSLLSLWLVKMKQPRH